MKKATHIVLFCCLLASCLSGITACGTPSQPSYLASDTEELLLLKWMPTEQSPFLGQFTKTSTDEPSEASASVTPRETTYSIQVVVQQDQVNIHLGHLFSWSGTLHDERLDVAMLTNSSTTSFYPVTQEAYQQIRTGFLAHMTVRSYLQQLQRHDQAWTDAVAAPFATNLKGATEDISLLKENLKRARTSEDLCPFFAIWVLPIYPFPEEVFHLDEKPLQEMHSLQQRIEDAWKTANASPLPAFAGPLPWKISQNEVTQALASLKHKIEALTTAKIQAQTQMQQSQQQYRVLATEIEALKKQCHLEGDHHL
uniref:Uncharacterized protein n=1 Tax=Thermosporothrix sp. COM3 TaxID=2490863 RepID=A0A455SXX7_9CHLR|nr:hypothetical protein KTC_64930 [Thermosporothrix sp. COM3]